MLLLCFISSRAEKGLNMVAKHPKSRFNWTGYAFSAGLGFGLMFGIISYITLLVQSMGPGVLMCVSCPNISLYFISGKKKKRCLFNGEQKELCATGSHSNNPLIHLSNACSI